MTTRLQMLIGLVMLLLGGMIYLLFRPTTLLLFHTLDMVGLMPLVTDWRTLAAACQPSEFVVYSLPGGLWAAAYILLVVNLLGRVRRWQRMTVASIIPLVGICSELMQRAGLLPGVFDTADLVCYAVPLIILNMYIIIKNLSIWQVSLTASTVSN
jgi:hypothetical protein